MSILCKAKNCFPHIKRGMLFYLNQGMEEKVRTALHSNLRINKITTNMCKDIVEIRNVNVQNAFERMIERGQICVFAYVNGRVAGHASCVLPKNREGAFWIKNSAYIHYCYVDPKYRGQNIYPLMLLRLIEICEKECGIKRFTITTSNDNISSQVGLKKVGFIFLKKYFYIDWWKFLWRKITI